MKNITGVVKYLGINTLFDGHRQVQEIATKENNGIVGDKHCDYLRRIDAREEHLLLKGFKKEGVMANFRQVTIMSNTDWVAIINKANLFHDIPTRRNPEIMPIPFTLENKDAKKFYGASGENMVVQIDERFKMETFSEIPIGARVFFYKNDEVKECKEIRNSSVVIMGQNNPCMQPNKEIHNRISKAGLHYGDKMFDFTTYALGLRGLYGVIQTGGKVKIGDMVVIEY